MSIDLGAAYIAILPSTSKLVPDLKKQIEGPLAKAGGKAGKGLGSSISAFASKQLKRAGKASLAGAGALVATAFYKGFQRLSAIEQAEKKLKTLGYEGKDLAGVMDNVTNAVTGTAFGLGEASTAAANALGSGVKAGKDLEQYLTLVGDAASFANVGFNDMGNIMDKVRGSGKIMGGELQQLQENGLSAASFLAEHMGISQEEVRKLASQGKISAAEFEAALRDKIGGQAKAAGDTVAGSSANMVAALGRIGASAMKPAFKRFPGVMQGWTKHLDKVNKKVGQFMEEFEKGEGAGGRFRDSLEKVWNTLTNVGDKIATVVGWLWKNKEVIAVLVGGYLTYRAALVVANAVSWIQYLWASKDVLIKATQIALTNGLAVAQKLLNGALKANPIGLVVLALTALVAGLVYAYKNSETFRNIVDKAWKMIKTTVVSVWQNHIRPAFEKLSDGVAKVKAAFIATKDGVGDAWAKLKSIVEKPIRASITFVNDKLIGSVNKIPGVNIPRIPGFARGGWTGPGGRNSAAGIVHADEFVLQKKARRLLEKVMPGALDYMNMTGRWPGYASGGKVKDDSFLDKLKEFSIDKVLKFAGRAMAGKTGVFGSSAVPMLKAVTKTAWKGIKTSLFDTGGVLPHNSMALNLSGKPEAILTNQQWKVAAKALEATSSGVQTINVNVHADDLGDIATIQQFLKQVNSWRNTQRTTSRSGRVLA